MFIYADESGNTGRAIFDAPPIYRVGALMSVKDAEGDLRTLLFPLNEVAGRDRIHGHKLTPPEAAEIAQKVLDVLDRASDWEFLIGSIEKDYLATTKFVDTVFDSGENKAVPPLWYNHQAFRHILCLAMDRALRDRYRREFWQAYLNDDIVGIQAIVRKAGEFVRMRESDRRLRQIVRDAFHYVSQYPQDFTLSASKGRRAYQGHTPNIVGFSFIFDSIHKFYERTGSHPLSFIHDRQQEFATSMKEWVELFGHVRRDNVGDFAELSLLDYQIPNLTLANSKDVFSLQAVDLLLWTSTRADAPLQPVHDRLATHLHYYNISRETSERIVLEFLTKISGEITPEAEIRANRLLGEMEADRNARISQRYQQAQSLLK